MIEECYELLEAIDEEDTDHMIEELGDVMLQVMPHAQIGEDEGISQLMMSSETSVRRWSDGTRMCLRMLRFRMNMMSSPTGKKSKGGKANNIHFIAGCRAENTAFSCKSGQASEKAAKIGFDWDDVQDIWDKVNEELKEFSAEASAESADEISLKAEFGDVLFALVNIGRYYKIEPEEALAMTNDKFRRRFAYIEKEAAKKGP